MLRMLRAMAMILPLLPAFLAVPRAFAADQARSIRFGDVEIAGAVTETALRDSAIRFSAVAEAVNALDSQRRFRQPVPIRIIVAETGNPLSETSVSGPFAEYIVFSIDDNDSRQAALGRFVAILLDNEFGTAALPPWLRTGLIEHFQRVSIVGREATIGGVDAAKRDPRPALKTFFETDHFAFGSQTKSSSAAFRVLSQRIVARLLSAGPERFGRLVAELEDGKPAGIALRQIYAIGDREISEYAASPAISLQMNLAAAVPAAAPIDGSAFAVWTNSSSTGRVADRIESLVATGSAEAFATASMLAEQDGNPELADKLTDQAVAKFPADHRVLFARASLRMGREMTEIGQSSGFSAAAADESRADLMRCIALDPRFAPAYSALGLLNAVRGEFVRETIDLLRRALSGAPGNFWLRMRLAELRAADRDFLPARQSVIRLTRAARTGRERVYAENTLLRMTALQSQLESTRSRKSGNDDGVTDAPLSEEEIARRRAKALNESLNLALRIPLEGEKRLLGTITKIECRRDAMMMKIVAGPRTLQLSAPSVESIALTSFVERFVNSEFGCGSTQSFGPAVITYRPHPRDSAKGEVVAVEFVPASFRFLD